MATVPAEPATAQQALHRALADNSVVTGWEPQHRIQFYHSRGDMVVPFGNYEAFHNAHPDGLDNIYRINDTFGLDGDHLTNNGDNWYTIDGRRLSGKPTRKGVYIHSGVKVVVR